MLRIAKRYPTTEMVEAASEINGAIDSKLITLAEFTAHWHCTYPELATLSNASVSTVKRWFSSSQQSPDFEHLYRLGRIHRTWSKIKNSSF